MPLPPAGPALDAGRCQRKARLAYPHAALCPAAHHPGEDAVRRRRTGVGPDQYRLRPGLDDHRSVPVGLSVGADFRTTKAAVKMHTLLDLRGRHSEFYPHLGWQAARRSCRAICSCRKPEPSTSWIVADVDFADRTLCVAPSRRAFFVTTVPSRRHRCGIASIRRRRIARPASFATRPSRAWTASTGPVEDYPELLLASIRFKDPESGWDAGLRARPTTSVASVPPPSASKASVKSRLAWCGRALLQVGSSSIIRIKSVLRSTSGERGEDRRSGLPSNGLRPRSGHSNMARSAL